jgi:hypothetical protein
MRWNGRAGQRYMYDGDGGVWLVLSASSANGQEGTSRISVVYLLLAQFARARITH